jgi:hypothetical protein
MTDLGTWRKSSYSAEEANCVELASFGAVRDSKNPSGGMLRADLNALLTAVTQPAPLNRPHTTKPARAI